MVFGIHLCTLSNQGSPGGFWLPSGSIKSWMHKIVVIKSLDEIFLVPAASCQLWSKAMEISGDIEPGSVAKLRKQAKALQTLSLKSIKLLANALAPACSLDLFLPKPGVTTSDVNALEQRPVLIVCSDEERKQSFVSKYWKGGLLATFPKTLSNVSYPLQFLHLGTHSLLPAA